MAQRWRITTENRVGMALDILAVVSGAGFDIDAMEVYTGLVYFRLENQLSTEVLTLLLALSGVAAVDEVVILPQEEREHHLEAVLATVSDGVVVIAADRTVAGLNPSASRILSLSASEAVGKTAALVLGTDHLPIAKAPFDNEEIRVKTDRGYLHYVASGRPLREAGGMVLALKSIQAVRDLVHSMTRPQVIDFAEIISTSSRMFEVISLARSASRVDATILLTGESGTGKELFARAIHSASDRSRGPFVPINCAALPEALLESELFGYEEGSFTGAKRGGKQGMFEFAQGGTLFLDEVGELPIHLQAKLLRALQEKRIRRVGGRDEIPVDVRVIAASNRNLRTMVLERQFRNDLYYRLNVIPILIPPLRERTEDIDVLGAYFLTKWSQRWGRPEPTLTAEAWQRLHEHTWPGNVRELENVVERALALAPEVTIGPEHFMLESTAVASPPMASDDSLRDQLAGLEKQILTATLTSAGSARRAALALGISHTTLLNKAHKLGLSHLIRA